MNKSQIQKKENLTEDYTRGIQDRYANETLEKDSKIEHLKPSVIHSSNTINY